MKKDNFYLLSLGCAKNTVDSESMAQVLEINTACAAQATPPKRLC